ncbi:MAG TPA: TlyA family RNA methyltransferase [Petrotogaceae bacterium]|nr:TlyA family RNA methyltransferase [Petrotogaceae bacterium]
MIDGKVRLDIFLSLKDARISRKSANSLIRQGKVTVNGKVVLKPSFQVNEEDTIIVLSEEFYVSRGAFKLQKALEEFEVQVRGKVCMDIGSSTGGFTQVLLRNDALRVICVDSGTDQLHPLLRNDARVVLYENTNARYFKADEKVDFICCDVSFISITKLTDTFLENSKDTAEFIFLVKPQFECGKEFLGKNGIVKDRQVHRSVLKNVSAHLDCVGLFPNRVIESPIKGSQGNTEFLLYCKRSKSIAFDMKNITGAVE